MMTHRRAVSWSAAIAAILLAGAFVTVPAQESSKTPAPGKSAPAPKPSPKGQGKVLYRGNTDSKVFHAPACSHYDCNACTVTFESAEEAVKAGYKACRKCKP